MPSAVASRRRAMLGAFERARARARVRVRVRVKG